MATGDFVEKVKQALGGAAPDGEDNPASAPSRADAVETSEAQVQDGDHFAASMYDAANNTGDATLNVGEKQSVRPPEKP